MPQARSKRMKLTEIAERINAHLKRFERDAKINIRHQIFNRTPYYNAGAGIAGRYVHVGYVSYGQDDSHLTRTEAEKYLVWLDAGNVGKHYNQMEASDAAEKAERAE